jgi:predicted metal-dependent phosphoesterase TrpH
MEDHFRPGGFEDQQDMVKFTRNKLVSIYRKDTNTLVGHGLLEDDIYGLEVDVALRLPDLEIVSVGGKWKRAENSECHRAVPFLQEAVGFRMDDGFTQRVQKTVGRMACRHFADILLECCYAARDAAAMLTGDEKTKSPPSAGLESPPLADRPPLSTRARTEQRASSPSIAGKVKQTGEMVIDLHVHTFPASSCSSMTVDEAIQEAKRVGLDAICLTDHNYVWDRNVVADLVKKYGFPIFRGNEITTDQGDVVVFGLEKDIQGIVKLEELREEVLRVGGFIIAAHPFRGFLTFGVGKLGLTPEKAMERPLFRFVDGVEVLNSKVTQKENGFAAEVTTALHLPATGGSDAHEPSAVGIYATRFFQPVKDEKGLIDALKSGNCAPLAFRGVRKGERLIARG